MKPTLITHVKEALATGVEQSAYQTDTIPVEDPPAQVDAFLASPLGFVLDSDNPAEAASTVAEHSLTGSPYIDTIVATGPYINVTVTDTYRSETVATLSDNTLPSVEDKQDIVVEHTSANPTGPLHIGSARNALIGNAVATALSYRGHDVTTQYYVNNIGLQVAVLVWAYQTMHDDSDIDAATLLDYYSEADDRLDEDELRAAVQGDDAAEPEAAVAAILNAIEAGDEDARTTLQTVVDTMVASQMASLHRFGISVDETVYESTFLDNGAVNDVLDALDEAGALTTDNGAQVVETEAGSLVLTRSSGTSVYAARDIAFHIQKLIDYDAAVTVLGEDHEAHAAQLTDVLGLLGYDTSSFTPVTHAFVSTPEGAMAKRAGTAVYLDDAFDAAEAAVATWLGDRDVPVDEVAAKVGQAALAYSLLSKRPSKPVTFDVDAATDVDANTGPALQYAYTRCHSLLDTVDGASTVDAFTHDAERQLAEALSELPTVLDAAGEGNPHVVAQYVFDVVEAFNAFYRDCPVQGAPAAIKQHRLALVEATKYSLSVIFDVLSIPETTVM